MKLICLSSVLLFLSVASANESGYPRESQSEYRGDKEDAVAYESFNSPVYGGPKSMPAPGKGYPLPAAPPLPVNYALPTGYTLPAAPPGYALPAAPALPTGYALPAAPVPPSPYTTYLNSLGSPYAASPYNAYNRYSPVPYSAPYYGYGAYGVPYGAPYAGYGYPTGLTYGNPSVLGRSAVAYNGYPGYAGLGYRYGGLGYNAFRGPAAPVAGVPAPVSAVPAAGIPAYAAPAVPVPSKGNALQYGYGPPAAQKLPVY